MSNAIEFNNVWKKFRRGEKFDSLRDAIPQLFKKITKDPDSLKDREFWAVKGVQFTIKPGEVVGIMGPNGAGKSTILKLLSRIMPPSKGDMKMNGRVSALIEVTAGFHPELTGRENVYLNGTILGMKKKEIDEKFDDIVEFSGISEFIDTPVKHYSSGMYSRLGFSVAAHMDPDILLVDEVLAVGDMAFRAKCAQKMRELLNSGATIVIVSHQLSLIQSLCKRVILLNQGEVIMDGPTDEVIPHYQNIVFRKSEEEFKRKVSAQDHKVRLNEEPLIKISEFKFLNGHLQQKESFHIGDEISMDIHFSAREKIERPIFYLEIMRSDGVLCCCAKSDEQAQGIEFIEGSGECKVKLGNINLAPGIYLAKLTIWDREMIHPYVIRKKDVFRIEVDGKCNNANAVFLPKIEWKF